MNTEKKSFGVALLVWLFFGGVGGHVVYVKENAWVLLYYWLFTVATFGLAPIIGLFRLKGQIQLVNMTKDVNDLKNK